MTSNLYQSPRVPRSRSTRGACQIQSASSHLPCERDHQASTKDQQGEEECRAENVVGSAQLYKLPLLLRSFSPLLNALMLHSDKVVPRRKAGCGFGHNLRLLLLESLAEGSAFLLLEDHDVETVEVVQSLPLLCLVDLFGPSARVPLALWVGLFPDLHKRSLTGTAGELGEDNGCQGAVAVAQGLAWDLTAFHQSLRGIQVSQTVLVLLPVRNEPCCGQ